MNKHYLKNIESYKKYYQRNREVIRKKQKTYNEIHKEELKEYFKDYHLKNKEKKCAIAKKWYKEHKEQRKIYNKTKGILNSNKYFIKRRKIDIEFRILCNLRKRIWKVLKGNNKSSQTIKLIGCSFNFLKRHLELQFKNGMTWSNYGKWHIDHIKPCASFDLSKIEEQTKCFNWKNLQPLWARENIIKKDKII